MVTALVLLFRLRAAEADHRVRADLLADLLRSNAPDRALVERGRLLGLRLREPHVVVVCRGERPRGLLLAASQAGAGAGLSGEHADAVVALVPGRDPSAVATALAGKFAVTVGTAGPIVPADGVAGAFAEARTAADTLVALGRAGTAPRWPTWASSGSSRPTAPTSTPTSRGCSARCSTTTPRAAPSSWPPSAAYFACGASPRRAAVAAARARQHGGAAARPDRRAAGRRLVGAGARAGAAARPAAAARARLALLPFLELQLEGVVAHPDPQALAVLGDVALLLLAQLARRPERPLRQGQPARRPGPSAGTRGPAARCGSPSRASGRCPRRPRPPSAVRSHPQYPPRPDRGHPARVEFGLSGSCCAYRPSRDPPPGRVDR